MAKLEKETGGSEPRERNGGERSTRAEGKSQKIYFPVPEDRDTDPTKTPTPDSAVPQGGRRRRLIREIAPAISPLIIGFALLLALIFVLGYLSVQRIKNVNITVQERLENRAATLRLLLDLKLAVTKLDNEARVRHTAESTRGLKPPFDFRVRSARDEVKRLLRELEKLSSEEKWAKLRANLQAFLDITADLRTYSLEGRDKFDKVEENLTELLNNSSNEQEEIINQNKRMQQEATESIGTWSLIALLVGALVAAGTMWEVQRRFRQMRRSTLEARRERTFTSQMLEGMVSAVAAIDEDNRLRSANAAFLQIFPEAFIGASVFEKFGPDDAMKMLTAATESRVSKSTYLGRWVCGRASDHTEKTFDVYSSPLAINGHQGQIVTLVDATEATEFERGLRRSESLAAVGQATAQVAHEIRNPLGSIRLGVSMLRDSVRDEEALNTIDLVERGITHLNKLVVDVTQFSRQKPLERSQVDLHELLDRSLDLVSESINEKRTPVEKTFSSEKLVGLWDGHQLRQVFVNVISNAIDASREESPIKITTKEVILNDGNQDGVAAKKYARIAIADLGKGIDPTKVDRIFEPFVSTKKRGTGLGLAIVKQIVEQHGGHISVDSQVGKGTRFTIDLPL